MNRGGGPLSPTSVMGLQSSGFNVLGTILNDVDPKKYRWTTYEGYYGTYDDY